MTAKYMIMHPTENEHLTGEQRAQVMRQDLLRLDRMIGYCKTTACLRAYILDYFGQQHPAECNNCGNCEADVVEQDITEQAEAIFECIQAVHKHLGYNLGASAICKVLSGSRSKRIFELKLDRLESYGMLGNFGRKELQRVIEMLENQGFIKTDPVHGSVSVTPASDEVLRGNKNVRMNVRADAPKPVRKPAGREEDGLFAALKTLRMKIAKEEHVPAYIVFSNATLQDMASKAPVSIRDLLKVSGVGQYKAERYGEAFVTEIARYLNSEEYDWGQL